MAETRIAQGPVDFSIANTQRMLSPVKSFAQIMTGDGTVASENQAENIGMVVNERLGECSKLTAPRPSKTL